MQIRVSQNQTILASLAGVQAWNQVLSSGSQYGFMRMFWHADW